MSCASVVADDDSQQHLGEPDEGQLPTCDWGRVGPDDLPLFSSSSYSSSSKRGGNIQQANRLRMRWFFLEVLFQKSVKTLLLDDGKPARALALTKQSK